MMNMVGSQLVLIKILFGVELLLAEFLFCGKLKRRNHFALRAVSSILITLMILGAFPVPVNLTDRFGPLYGIFMYSAFYFLTVLCLMFCFQEKIWLILFISAAAYTIEHIASCANSIFNQFDHMIPTVQLPILGLSAYRILTYIITLGGIYILAYFIVVRRLQLDETLQFAKKTILFLCGTVIVVNHAFILLYFGLIPENQMIDNVLVYAFNIVCCILILAMQTSVYEHTQNLKEFAVIEKLWQQAKEQYKVSKENIDAMNIRCHDMKHLIHKMEQEHNAKELDDISKIIESYDVGVETGNEILDVILTEKAMYCQRNGIQFTCIVNGQILDFIGTTDLYVLFGNLIDNCINAVKYLQQENRKNIRINVNQEKQFVIINTENYYEAELEFVNGLPVTTNSDKMNHGYGMRSIENMVKKYNGQLNIRAEDGIFSLSILIPIPKKQKKSKK